MKKLRSVLTVVMAAIRFGRVVRIEPRFGNLLRVEDEHRPSVKLGLLSKGTNI